VIDISKGRKFVKHVVPGIIKPAHILWNEVIGFLFICIGVLASPSAIRNIRNFDGDPKSIFRVGLSLSFVLIMIAFGTSSFLKARRIARK